MIKQAYINGFMRKCAEHGVDGRKLLKAARLSPMVDMENTIDDYIGRGTEALRGGDTIGANAYGSAAENLLKSVYTPAMAESEYARKTTPRVERPKFSLLDYIIPRRMGRKVDKFEADANDYKSKVDPNAAIERRLKDQAIQKAMIWGMGNPEAYKKIYADRAKKTN